MADVGLKIVVGADLSAVTDGMKVASNSVAQFGDQTAKAFDEIAASASGMDRVSALIDKLAAEALGAGQQLEGAFQEPIKSIAQLESQIESLESELSTSTDFATLKRLNDQIAVTKTQLNNLKVVGFESTLGKINPAATGAANGLNKLTGASKAAGGALLDINRVIQDSAFGFVGIQNNITQLPQSFRALSAAAKESGQSVGKVLLGTLLGPAGIGTAISVITSALTFASVGFGAWTRGFTSSSEAAKKAAGTLDEYQKLVQSVSGEVGKSASRITTLVNALQSDSLNTAQRKKALDELKQQNQEFFGSLKEEKGLINGLQAAYDGYLERIKAIATAKAIESQLTKLFDKKLELELNIDPKFNAAVNPETQRQIGILKKELNKLGGTVDVKASDDLSKVNDNLRKRIELQNRINKLQTVNIVDLSGSAAQIEDIERRIKGLTELQKVTGNFGITGTSEKQKKDQDFLSKQLSLLEKIRDAANDFQGKLFDLKDIDAATDKLAALEQQVGNLKLQIALRDAKKAGLPASEIAALQDAIKADTQKRLNEAFEKEALLLEFPKLKFSQINRFDISEIANKVFTSKEKIKIILGENGIDVSVKKESVDITDLQDKISKATGLDKKIPVITLHEVRVKLLGVKLTKSVELEEALRKDLSETVTRVLNDAIIDSFSHIGESLGKAIAGGGIGNLFTGLFDILATGLQAFGKALLAYGVALLGFKVAMKTINPVIAIVAGVAAIAAGAAVKASLPKFADGGIVTGPIIGQIGEMHKPEVIMPLDRLKAIIGSGINQSGDTRPVLLINNEGLYFQMKMGERSAGRKF